MSFQSFFTCLLFTFLLIGCREKEKPAEVRSLFAFLEGQEGIAGKKEYKQTPYVTAGDRVYLVGHQDGTFPDLGWHVAGEMGGLWNHPIKLLDGFVASLEDIRTRQSFCLDTASQFENYPWANVLTYDIRR